MTTSLEAPTAERAPLRLADVPPGMDVAQTILDHAQPLLTDEVSRRQFYDELGVVRTGIVELDSLGKSVVLAKPDITQDSKSYKRRGATFALMRSDARTAVTYSTGNHGQAVMLAGARLGMHVVIELPDSVSEAKLQPLVEGEAELHFHTTFGKAQEAAEAQRGLPGVAVIPPFGHEDVLAGQCSLGFEIVEDLILRGLANSKVTIPVPVAGGGLLSGIALPIWQAKQQNVLGKDIQVVGVQPEGTDMLGRAVECVQAGLDPVGLLDPKTIDRDCDALAITEESLHPLTLAVAAEKRFVRSFYRIGKLALAYARQYLSDQLGVEVEPAAALPMAFALEHQGKGQNFLLPVTGRNVSLETRTLYDGLVIADRVRQFQEASKQQLKNASTLGYPKKENTLRGVWRSPVTRRYVLSARERAEQSR